MDPIAHSTPSTAQGTAASTLRPVPDETATPMPEQDLWRWRAADQVRQAKGHWTTRARRTVIFTATLALTAAASYEMYQVLNVSAMTTLQVALLIVFIITFAWIALPFVSGLAGLVALWRGRSASVVATPSLDATSRLTTRTALVMPIYNEATPRVFAGIQAIYESLDAIGALQHFDFFILSDTTEPEVWLEEEVGFWELRRRTGGGSRIFYRHRARNFRRKAGNIADFCQRWGARYDHMVILDADSLMTGETLVQLAAAMEADPEVGLIQTLPLLVNRNTVFARMQQFAARLYGPVIAAGLAYWHVADSSYWGHNAILRTRAFIEHAGLPDLLGAPPFGGHILSHDFVEAALLRRAGWKVCLAAEVTGSYEESPPSLIDFAERDRRWCQGNLQHIRLVLARGLHWMSRLHLGMGIMSYLASPIWLIFILLGFLLALQAHFIRPEYFSPDLALFPTWPVFNSERAVRLFVVTMAVLVAPKLFGYARLCTNRQLARRFGGLFRAGVSVVFETVVSALIAPVMMLMQSAAVVGILTGRGIGWKTQRRDDGSIPLRVAAHRHRNHPLFGLILAAAAYAISPQFLAWMSPLVVGLLIAIPLSAGTARQEWGQLLRKLGLLVTPEETEPPVVLQRANELADELAARSPKRTDALEWIAYDEDLRALHMAMLPTTPQSRKGAYDVDLLLGLAKLQDSDSLVEASSVLSRQEKLAVLGNPAGVQRLSQLAPVPQALGRPVLSQ
ncbi:MAG TPA: glucans biosynthesis glucosyltransferase MdoH [Candidatus Tectomicrobia bacterium]|nr:glucans biosynthesis glucosyltransferase MdoH [Candidatus Tectomicrobia bacterium]